MEKIVPSAGEEYNVFGYTKGKAMALSVITNGGKVQDHFLKKYLLKSEDKSPGSSDWLKYINMAGDHLLRDTVVELVAGKQRSHARLDGHIEPFRLQDLDPCRAASAIGVLQDMNCWPDFSHRGDHCCD